MIQYKEKVVKQQNRDSDSFVSVGLFDYPILMTADVLLYQTDLVPVGQDQKQHIELSRDIAKKFNDLYLTNKQKRKKQWILKEPRPLILEQGAKIMSLDDGQSKMSKSNENDESRINLLDSPEVIKRKIKRCKTDSEKGLEFDNEGRPECHNLLTIYQLVTGKSKEEVQRECGDMKFGTFKPLLADAVAEHLQPIQNKYKRFIDDSGYLEEVLKQGRERAEQEAQTTVDAVKKCMGFVLPGSLAS